MNILIAGGGIVGSFLAQSFSKEHQVTVIEKERSRYESIAATLAPMPVIYEDACEPWVLELAGIAGADLVLALTGDDEDNLIVSFLARWEYDVPKVIARVNNPRNQWLYNPGWGVDVGVGMPEIIERIVLEETSLGEVITLMKLRASDVGLVEITVPPDSKVITKRLSELELPPDTLIVSVVRQEGMLIPKAELVLEPEDRVLAITRVEQQGHLKRLLG
ncbi:MAG: potassium channel family protein, partial [Candidatus Geothermincolia bacterium]